MVYDFDQNILFYLLDFDEVWRKNPNFNKITFISYKENVNDIFSNIFFSSLERTQIRRISIRGCMKSSRKNKVKAIQKKKKIFLTKVQQRITIDINLNE